MFLTIGISIYLSPNPLIGTIGIDNPFTTLLFRTICIDRPITILLFRMIGIGTYTFRHFTVSVFVGEQRRLKTARLGAINSSSPFIIYAARHSSPEENPRIRGCLSWLCPKKLKVDGINNKVVRSSSLQCFRATCLYAVQFLFLPWIIPYRIGCWANNRSAIMRIDTITRHNRTASGSIDRYCK